MFQLLEDRILQTRLHLSQYVIIQKKDQQSFKQQQLKQNQANIMVANIKNFDLERFRPSMANMAKKTADF